MSNYRLIAHGISANNKIQIFLDRWDDTYTVSIHEEGHKTIREDFDSMTWSYRKFFESCHDRGIEPVKDI